jgi:hypothetical protein
MLLNATNDSYRLAIFFAVLLMPFIFTLPLAALPNETRFFFGMDTLL